MQNVPITKLSHWIARLVVAAVFLVAAVPKIADPGAFAQSIENYRLVEAEAASLFALWLPWFEVVLALSLLTGWGKKASALMSASMLLVFCGAIGWVMYQGIDIDCGCFGAENEAKANGWSLLRNAVLILLCVWVVFSSEKHDLSNKKNFT